MKKTIFILVTLCFLMGYFLWVQISQVSEKPQEVTMETKAPEAISEKPKEDTIPINEQDRIAAGNISLDLKWLEKNSAGKENVKNEELKKAFIENRQLIEDLPKVIKKSFGEACSKHTRTKQALGKCFKSFKLFLNEECKNMDISSRIKCFSAPDINKFKLNFKPE